MGYSTRQIEFKRRRRVAAIIIRKRLGRPKRVWAWRGSLSFKADFRRLREAMRACSRAMARFKIPPLLLGRPKLTTFARRRQEFRARFREYKRRIRIRALGYRAPAWHSILARVAMTDTHRRGEQR